MKRRPRNVIRVFCVYIVLETVRVIDPYQPRKTHLNTVVWLNINRKKKKNEKTVSLPIV